MNPKRPKVQPEEIMNEAPSVIGMMAVTLSSGGSFDVAVREIARSGPKSISGIFSRIVIDADCRAVCDIKKEVMAAISSFPESLSPFKRAMRMVVTAFETADVKERTAIMKDAEEIILEGLKTMGESFSSSLNTPCMMIFGLGIMLPMILVSMLPMLSIGGLFSVSFIDSRTITLLVIVVIPLTVGALILSLRGKNPFFKAQMKTEDLRFLAPMIVAIPAYIILMRLNVRNDLSICIAFIIGGLVTFCSIFPSIVKEKERLKKEDALKGALFELGNRLSMGENIETAIKKALGSREGCSSMSAMLERELMLCRGDIESAITAVMGKISVLMTGHYCDIYRASKRDIRNAGKLATSIAHQIQDQNGVRKSIENKLKSMMDMMSGTSAIFAPIILGMSIVMLGPITEITGQVFFDNIGSTLAIYLVELAALISLMSSNLMCKGKTVDIMARFSLTMPISLVVFMICSSFTL